MALYAPPTPRHGAEPDTLNPWPRRRWGRPAEMSRLVEKMRARQVVMFVFHTRSESIPCPDWLLVWVHKIRFFFFFFFLQSSFQTVYYPLDKLHNNIESQCLTQKQNIRTSQKHKYVFESGHVPANTHLPVTTYPEGSLLKSGVKCRVSRVLTDPGSFSRADLNGSHMQFTEVKECRSSLASSPDDSHWIRSAAFGDCQNVENFIVFAAFCFFVLRGLGTKTARLQTDRP